MVEVVGVRITTDGFSKLIFDLGELEDVPKAVAEDILNAQAAVIEDAQKKTAREMGVYRTGALVRSIKRGKVVKTKSGYAIYVVPSGTVSRGKRSRKTVNMTEIAFLNEYGTHKQPARPFIKTANERAAPEAVKAAEKIYNEYLTRKGL